MKVVQCVFGSILSIVLFSSITVLAQEPSPQKIRVLTLLGRPLPVVVAEMHGTFAKYGIEVQTENCPSSDLLRANLAAGKGDIAYAAVDNAVAMAELAKVDVVIVMGGEGSQNELITQVDIKSVKDLRGKILIVDAPNTAYALQMKKIFLLNGMQAERDYEIKPIGVTPLRLAAMREHKEYAGSMLGPPASIIAKREGFVSLGTIQNLLGPYQAAGSFAQRTWTREHSDTLVRYLAAFVEAQRWLMTPANKKQVIEMMMKEMHLSADVAAETYDVSMNQPGGYEADSGLDLEGFKNVLKLRAEVEGQWEGHPPSPDKYYDSSYYQAALARAKVSK